jgi:transposase-like protein
MAHFERNVLAKTPRWRRRTAAAKLKAVFAMENREKTLAKAESVAAELTRVTRQQ